MKYVKTTVVLSSLLILAGLLFIVYFRDQQTTIVTDPPKPTEIAQARAAAPPIVQRTETPVLSGEPVHLTVSGVGIDLAVTPGVYNERTGQWTLTRDKAQYAVMTPQPNNQTGNTFIYGHYRKGVFSTLHKAAPGSKAVVTTANGKTFTYVLKSSKVVAPEESQDVFNHQGAPMLTIQTCTGLFFEKRQLFFFDLESVS